MLSHCMLSTRRLLRSPPLARPLMGAVLGTDLGSYEQPKYGA